MNKWLMTKEYKHFAKHLKVHNPKHGFVSFQYHPYLQRLKETIDNNSYVIFKKFRQGGFTTFNITHALWNAISKPKYDAVIMCRTDSEADVCIKMAQAFYGNLPTTRSYPVRITSAGNFGMRLTNGSSFSCHTPISAVGLRADLVYMDEPAFWNNAEEMWKIIYPYVSCGGKIVVGSTPNGTGNWFHKMYENALSGKKNSFKVFKADYTECPFWTKEMVETFMKNAGPKCFSQELLAEFV